MFEMKGLLFAACCVCLYSFLMIGDSLASAITPASSMTISDSEEPYNRRIYSYDMGIDSKGDVHIVYSDPYTDFKANIYYRSRISGKWQVPKLLTSNGARASISTLLLVGNDDRIHVCYIEVGAEKTLKYRSIKEETVGAAATVYSGGWHTRMQMGDNGFPMFIRENETYPALETKLALFTTDNGIAWERNYLHLNPSPLRKFRIADFIYTNGQFHITYGNSAYTKLVIGQGNQSFHDLFYATSSDGENWVEYKIDDSRTLYEREFWTSMVLDSGRPLVAMYKYNEYGGQYNTGTSAILMTFNGTSWQKKTITNINYPDSREGMGVGLVANGTNDYFGVWDFSPADTHDDDFRGPRGNIALTRSGPEKDWSPKVQMDLFSLEGRAVLRMHKGKLFFLGLGDFVDAKLYFREYSIEYLSTLLPSERPGGGGGGVSLPAVNLLLIN